MRGVQDVLHRHRYGLHAGFPGLVLHCGCMLFCGIASRLRPDRRAWVASSLVVAATRVRSVDSSIAISMPMPGAHCRRRRELGKTSRGRRREGVSSGVRSEVEGIIFLGMKKCASTNPLSGKDSLRACRARSAIAPTAARTALSARNNRAAQGALASFATTNRKFQDTFAGVGFIDPFANRSARTDG
jgi:hypothetical protein